MKMYGQQNDLMLVHTYLPYSYKSWLENVSCEDYSIHKKKKYLPRGYSERYTIRISDYVIITIGATTNGYKL
jgi:hypothetical protein